MARNHPEILNQLEKHKISQKRKRDESQIDQNQIYKSDEEVEENSDASTVSNQSKKKRSLAGHFQPITQFVKYKPGDVKQLRADMEIMTFIAIGEPSFPNGFILEFQKTYQLL